MNLTTDLYKSNSMRYFVFFFVLVGCNTDLDIQAAKQENTRLQKEVDSLKNELHKCDMILESYEGMPMNI